jgi:hypothetical protein
MSTHNHYQGGEHPVAEGIGATLVKDTRLTVMRALRVAGAVWWAAPYSTGFTCTLPPGATLRCIADVTLDEPDALIKAMSEADAEALLVPGEDRLARNLVFLCIVLAHGFRRMLPPY